MKSRPEVVITGLGALTAAGPTAEESWASLLQGRRCVSSVRFEHSGHAYTYAAGKIDPFPRADNAPETDRCVHFALAAAGQALAQANLSPGDPSIQHAACVFSLSKPPPTLFAQLVEEHFQNDDMLADPLAAIFPNTCCRQVAHHYGLIGPRLCLPTACATGAHAIIRAAGLILDGQADCVLAGASEASLVPLYLAAFDRMGVLANDPLYPAQACKPFDVSRSGFVLGEGAAAVVLESAIAASQRGVKPLARIAGYWQGTHAQDLLRLESNGKSLSDGISHALHRAKIAPPQLDHIFAHGTGTVANDISETAAIKLALGHSAKSVTVSSEKGAVGHLLAAAGTFQVVQAVKSIQQSIIPPTVNLTQPDPRCDLDYTMGQARLKPIRHALTISAGFGGQCGLIALGHA